MSRPNLLRLLAACKADPEDDAARLVLADWLEEYGDEDDRQRAAFVRLEMTSGQERGAPDLALLRARIWRENQPRWAAFPRGRNEKPSSINGLVGAHVPEEMLVGERGERMAASEAWAWVERLAVRPTLARVASVLASAPLATVAGLALPAFEEEVLERLADCPRPVALRGLSLQGSGLIPGIAPLLRSPFVAGLRGLWFAGVSALPAVWDALGAPGPLEGLQRLALPALDSSAECVRAFASAMWRLSALRVDASRSPRPLTTAFRAESCAGLRSLSLEGVSRAIDFQALASAGFWPTLKSLHLSGAEMAAESAERLARCPAAPRLRVLTLGVHVFTAEALGHIARSPLCAALDCLRVKGSGLWPPGAARALALTAMPAAPRALDLNGCNIGDDGVAALAAWPGLSRCRVLSLAGNHIKARGLAALAASPHATGLIGLNLSDNAVGDDGLAAFLASGRAGRLEQLHIIRSGVTASSTDALAAAGMMSLREVRADHRLAARLRKALPHIPCVE